MTRYDEYCDAMKQPRDERVPVELSVRALLLDGSLERMVKCTNDRSSMTLTNEELMHVVNIILPLIV